MGVCSLCAFGIGEDAAVPAAEYGRAVHPQRFGRARRSMRRLYLVRIVVADLCQIRETVHIERSLNVARLVKVLADVELFVTVGRAHHRGEIAARRAADDADVRGIDVELRRIRAQIAHGRLHILQRLREDRGRRVFVTSSRSLPSGITTVRSDAAGAPPISASRISGIVCAAIAVPPIAEIISAKSSAFAFIKSPPFLFP